MTDETDDPFWNAAQATAWRLRLRAVGVVDRLGDDATPEEIAEEVMAETRGDELRLGCFAYAHHFARLELEERGMPTGDEENNDLETIERGRRATLRERAESCGVRWGGQLT